MGSLPHFEASFNTIDFPLVKIPSTSPASQATSQLPLPAPLPLRNLRVQFWTRCLFSFHSIVPLSRLQALTWRQHWEMSVGSLGLSRDRVDPALPTFTGWGPERPSREQYHQRTVHSKSNTRPYGETEKPYPLSWIQVPSAGRCLSSRTPPLNSEL